MSSCHRSQSCGQRHSYRPNYRPDRMGSTDNTFRCESECSQALHGPPWLMRPQYWRVNPVKKDEWPGRGQCALWIFQPDILCTQRARPNINFCQSEMDDVVAKLAKMDEPSILTRWFIHFHLFGRNYFSRDGRCNRMTEIYYENTNTLSHLFWKITNIFEKFSCHSRSIGFQINIRYISCSDLNQYHRLISTRWFRIQILT